MCDSMVASEDFKTIVYQSGHAVFERVSGGDSMMFEYIEREEFDGLVAYVNTFAKKSALTTLENELANYLSKDEAAKTYVTMDNYNGAISLLRQALTNINNTLGDVDTSNGTVAERIAALEAPLPAEIRYNGRTNSYVIRRIITFFKKLLARLFGKKSKPTRGVRLVTSDGYLITNINENILTIMEDK